MFAAFLCAKGVPALRQDWSWFRPGDPVLYGLSASISPWSGTAFGNPNVYVFNYVLAVLLQALTQLTTPTVSFVLAAFGAGCLGCWAACRIRRICGAPAAAAVPLVLFLVFNPWVYTKIVAGHFFMVVAYFALTALVAELFEAESDSLRAALLLVLCTAQLQFYLVGLIVAAIVAIRRRSYVVPITGVLTAAPIAFSLLWAEPYLKTIPINVSWEYSQSVRPYDAAQLLGYFAGYTAGWINWFGFATWFYPACAIVTVVVIRSRRTLWLALGAAIILLFAGGSRVITGDAFNQLVLHVPLVGVYRELYDVLGFLAIVYAILVGLAAKRSPRLAVPLSAIAGIGLAAYWFLHPPSAFWVSRSAVPDPQDLHAANARVLLLPALQPLRLNGTGSGADPDVYVHSDFQTPINEYFPVYPVNAALGAYLNTGSTQRLAALSVATIVNRPTLSTNVGTLQQQLSSEKALLATHNRQPIIARVPNPLPILSIQDPPAVVSIGDDVGDNGILFSDAGLGGIFPVPPPKAAAQLASDWIDARLTFLQYPEAAQAIGGAATTQSRRPLALPSTGRWILAFVRGRLVDNTGMVIARGLGAYKWIPRGNATRFVRCLGLCVVAATGEPPKDLPENGPQARGSGVPLHFVTPWLADAVIPPHDRGMLRFNVRYNAGWSARLNGAVLPHVKIDGIINGFTLTPSRAAARVVLINDYALVQTLLMFVGFAWALGVAARTVTPLLRPSGRRK